VPDLAVHVTKGKKELGVWRVRIDGGAVTAEAAGPDVDEGADLVVTHPVDDLRAGADGSLTIDESFMRGSTKVVGSMGTFMDLLPVLRGEAWQAVARELAEATAS
jgi:hypothetical protein